MKQLSTFSFIPLVLLITLLLSGCSLLRLNKELDYMETLSTLEGRVENTIGDEGPILLMLVLLDDTGMGVKAIVSERILYGDGDFKFYQPPGNYFLFAFQDTNEDSKFQPTENAGWHGDTWRTIRLGTQNLTNLKVVMRSETDARQQFPAIYQSNPPEIQVTIPEYAFDEVTSLDDLRFSAENGKLGLWEPIRFSLTMQPGFYFLQPYSPDKIPVLFVHGVGGHPGQWRDLVEQLDQTHFQPWFFYYPSGLRLQMLGEWLSEQLHQLQGRYEFKQLYIVAHSMGGLVSRYGINELLQNNQGDFLQLFISLSTPWAGHELASKGVKYSPVIIPNWYDVAPGSPFLKKLFASSWPDRLSYHLLFGYQGSSLLSQDSSDGVIALKSQLRDEAQEGAVSIRGFDENHTSILHAQSVAETLKHLLERRRIQ
jgi:pimeloyl-ACP methyl ester carboxylesterase